MTQVKFCGLVRPEDVRCAVELGVDAIGFVFYSQSPRALDLATAVSLKRLIPSHIETVGLFVNETPEVVAQVAKTVSLDRLQLHGDETPEQCQLCAELTGLPWWRAVRCRDRNDLVHSFSSYAAADGFLIDSYSPMYGGTGKTFDWQLLREPPASLQRSIIMSGGLEAQNVQLAISSVHPMAVDVSSGIQGVNPRVKDPAKMAAFMQAVKIANLV
jgi:phosphoribosylanthranilate isomerase